MARSLSNLVDSLAAGIDNIELLNVNMDMIVKNVVNVKLNTNIAKNVENVKLNTRIDSAIWNIQVLKIIYKYTNVHVVTGICKKKVDDDLKN